MTLGPVQVLVVGFEEPTFSGEVLAELARLQDSGLVRLIDLLLVAKSDDGALETLDLPAVAGIEYGSVAAALFSTAPGQEVRGDGWSLADALHPGQAAAVALLEHRWAAPLAAAIASSGGAPLDEMWLAPEDRELLQSLLNR